MKCYFKLRSISILASIFLVFIKISEVYLAKETSKKTLVLADEELKFLIDDFRVNGNNVSCFSLDSCAQIWLARYDFILGKLNEKEAYLQFKFDTNITTENQNDLVRFWLIQNEFYKISKPVSIKFLENLNTKNETLSRLLNFASKKFARNNPRDLVTLTQTLTNLRSIFATSKYFDSKTNKSLSLEPEFFSIFAKSRDYDELLWAWKGWREAVGPKVLEIYPKSVDLQNKAAQENGYNDFSEFWIDGFEDKDFEKNMYDLYVSMKPYYEQLHAYVRRKLSNFYSAKYPSTHNSKLIPFHLLGSVSAITWSNIYNLVKPYPDVEDIDLTKFLLERNFTNITMFQKSEEFYASLGLDRMTPSFWKYSMLEKPQDREVQCHATYYDFYNGFDYRIRMCSQVGASNFKIAFHEMGHVEYAMSYKNQPNLFKLVNQGFHESIGDTVILSAFNVPRLKIVTGQKNKEMSHEESINYLMEQALESIAFIPISYTIDKWRYDVFRKKITPVDYNQKWWQIIEAYAGLEVPTSRSEKDFDPAAVYHITTYFPYYKYFAARFLQFQFYKAMCTIAKHTGPLHKCDFFDSLEAGQKFREMLELGSSKHWSVGLKNFTGDSTINSKAIIEYFQPLFEWLMKENKKFPEDQPGW